MKEANNISKKDLFFSLGQITCILFTIFSLLFNVFYSIILWPLLPNIGVNLLTLLISFILASIILIFSQMLKKPIKITKFSFILLAPILFTAIFVVFNISTVFLKNVWNLYSILIILVLSFVISLIKFYVPIKSFLLKSIIYYILFAIPYFIITLAFGDYGKENQFLIVFAVYTVVYILSNIIVFLIKKHKQKSDNESKEYIKQFK